MIKKYYENFDQISYDIGVIDCFCEMVSKNVKPLAFSHPLSIENYNIIEKISEEIAENYCIKSYLEKDLASTRLFPDDNLNNKYVILYYKDDEVINDYLKVKKHIYDLMAKGSYNYEEKENVLAKIKKMLGYEDNQVS